MVLDDPDGLRHVDGAPERIEESGAQLSLELAGVVRERRLAEVECLGGPPEAARLGDGEEDLELAQRHGSGFPYRSDLNSRLDLIASPGHSTGGGRHAGKEAGAELRQESASPPRRRGHPARRTTMIFQQFLYPETGCAAYVFG